MRCQKHNEGFHIVLDEYSLFLVRSASIDAT